MKTLTRTMIVLVAVNLIAAGSVFAGNGADEGTSDSVGSIQVKEADRARKKADLLKELALKQTSHSSGIALPSVSISRNMLLGSRPGSIGSVLVIPLAETTTEEIATITEDMSVMSRIFEKNLERTRIDVSSMFISGSEPFDFVFRRGRQATQGMYLQGYGALFLMKVDFPLSPPPQVEEEKETQEEEDVDPVWAEMQREMYEPGESRRRRTDQPAKEYDAEKVANLKTTLVKSLKHAANIRSLKANESVILTITGSGVSSGYKSISSIPGRNEVVVVDHNNDTRIIKGDLVGDIGLSLPTILVIRAKKSDIDGFAKGDLDLDQFRQNTQIFTCAYLAGEAGSENPFTGSYFYTTKLR